uniref:Uncharacterized protein n=1 Tax=Magallana gigas TaxID=29159 RepID=A0A8W8IT22_MAGGI
MAKLSHCRTKARMRKRRVERRASDPTSQKFANTILQWKPINQRLLYVRLNTRYAKVSIVSASSLIDKADEEAKDNFYSSLQAVLDEIPRHDVTY